MKKKIVLFLFLFFQVLHSQDIKDGVVPFKIPARNSLKINRFVINPTFSFVRETNSYIALYNKRQWSQLDDAPQTFLGGFSGRISEKQGAGLNLFQQSFGLFTIFGGVLNFAQNVQLEDDSNLTFGLNITYLKSGFNSGAVIANDISDAVLNRIPSNSNIIISPGLNYGTSFLDFGLYFNNLVTYDLSASKLFENDPEKSISAHIMHTGFVTSYGFFDQSKFSAMIKAEFMKDKTAITGLSLISVPKGFWLQAGYNTLYGVSGGVGVNISKNIAFEYNYEKSLSSFSDFGSTHEFALVYRFTKKKFYSDDNEDEEVALISTNNSNATSRNNTATTTNTATKTPDANAKAKLTADAAAKVEAERLRKEEVALKIKKATEAREAQVAAAKIEMDRKRNEALDKIQKAKEVIAAQKVATINAAKERERLRAEALKKNPVAASTTAKQPTQKEIEDKKIKDEAIAKKQAAEAVKAKETADKAKVEAEILKVKQAAETTEKARIAAQDLKIKQAAEAVKAKETADKAKVEAE
ncbi:MAG: hypothetical protein QG594_212, partial [Bacteroidota bacterium]|nr:hypothetical protein [Bacteroidota bacterium]